MSTREERLDALKTAVEEWADRRIGELESQRDFLQAVFSGRTTGGELAEYVNAEASALLDDEINAFLAE